MTLQSLNSTQKLFNFINRQGSTISVFNIEEKEGSHLSSDLECPQFADVYRTFLRHFLDLVAQGGKPMMVREFERSIIAIREFSKPLTNEQTMPFGIISVDCGGNLSTFSPELLGLNHPVYGAFSFRNVLDNSFETIASRVEDSKLYSDINAG